MNQRQIRIITKDFLLKTNYYFFMKLLLIIALISALNYITVSTSYAATNTKNSKATIYVGKTTNFNNYLVTIDSIYSIYDYSNVTYSSANKKLVTIDKKGNIKGIKEGKTYINVTLTSDSWRGTEITKLKVSVEVIPYDGSTAEEYFDYQFNNGEITISGLIKPVADVVVPKQIFGYPVIAIGNYAFSEASKLKSITLLGNIKTIKEGAFYQCPNLKSVKLCDTITEIDYGAFSYCESLESIELPNKLKIIESEVFSYCTNLQKVKLGKNITTIKQAAFYECKALKDLVLPKSLSIIDSLAFDGCASLTELDIPSSIKIIRERAFSGCSSVTKLNIPEGVTSIEAAAFIDCASIENIEIPNKVEVIGPQAFYGCTALKRVVIPDSVKKIGDSAFGACVNLYEINVNQNIKREVEEYILIGTPYSYIETAYVKNMTFHLTEYDWKIINMLLDTIKLMDIQDSDSDLEKIRKVHDWMVINTSYSDKQFTKYDEEIGTLRTVLEKHFGICGGYSDVFMRFMLILNIECIEVVSDEMNHAWNMVKLDDGCWYHIDVTWDDPGWNDEVWEKGYLRYSNLLRDDEGIKSTGHHDWSEYAPIANGTKYLNYFDINYCVQF